MLETSEKENGQGGQHGRNTPCFPYFKYPVRSLAVPPGFAWLNSGSMGRS